MSDSNLIVGAGNEGPFSGAFSYSPPPTAGDAREWAAKIFERAFSARGFTATLSGTLSISSIPLRVFAQATRPGGVALHDAMEWLKRGEMEFGGDVQTVQVRYRFEPSLATPVVFGFVVFVVFMVVPYLNPLPTDVRVTVGLLGGAATTAIVHVVAGWIVAKLLGNSLRDVLRAGAFAL